MVFQESIAAFHVPVAGLGIPLKLAQFETWTFLENESSS
jgi:hypothetical protein